MSRAYRSIIRLTPVMLSLVLSGCSWLNWFSDDKSGNDQRKVKTVTQQDWSYSHKWQLTGVPESVSNLMGESVELRGQCQLPSHVVQHLGDRKHRGLVLPLLRVDKQQTLSPDLEASARLYKSLDRHLKLEPAGASLAFYQTLLASVEHACPENATREIDSCIMKGWLSMGGLFSSDNLYDWGRLQQWTKSHSSTGYLLMFNADLYNSAAMLHTRYSRYGRVLTKADVSVRTQAITPYVGSLRLDWVSNDFANKKKFVSRGFCQLHWGNEQRELSAVQRQDVREALMPEFMQFMEKAFQKLPMTR